MKWPIPILICIACFKAVAGTPYLAQPITDHGNTLREALVQTSNGKLQISWELIREGQQPEVVKIWTESPDSWLFPDLGISHTRGNTINYPKDLLGLGYPGPILFQVNGDILDVLFGDDAAGGVALAQFQQQNGDWHWTKFIPLGGFSENIRPVSGRWLGPGKVEVMGGDRGDKATFEISGYFDEAHPELQVALKDGKPWPGAQQSGQPLPAPGALKNSKESIPPRQGTSATDPAGSSSVQSKQASSSVETESDRKNWTPWALLMAVVIGLALWFFLKRLPKRS